ncbi:hypothetical protein L798_12284 [Zootermopsis nevadensis]|uniref:Uncharacterized protein n=1 Tax=Zootermopsis nevadensis TaxID=136037 RepID=A0A067R3G1_ZOONE|nr:hypothetical protein L798_12284 [Zootermopsis nevadensis]
MPKTILPRCLRLRDEYDDKNIGGIKRDLHVGAYLQSSHGVTTQKKSTYYSFFNSFVKLSILSINFVRFSAILSTLSSNSFFLPLYTATVLSSCNSDMGTSPSLTKKKP